MSIVLATLTTKDNEIDDVDVSCTDFGGPIYLEQSGDVVVLNNAMLQQLSVLLEQEMAKR